MGNKTLSILKSIFGIILFLLLDVGFGLILAFLAGALFAGLFLGLDYSYDAPLSTMFIDAWLFCTTPCSMVLFPIVGLAFLDYAQNFLDSSSSKSVRKQSMRLAGVFAIAMSIISILIFIFSSNRLLATGYIAIGFCVVWIICSIMVWPYDGDYFMKKDRYQQPNQEKITFDSYINLPKWTCFGICLAMLALNIAYPINLRLIPEHTTARVKEDRADERAERPPTPGSLSGKIQNLVSVQKQLEAQQKEISRVKGEFLQEIDSHKADVDGRCRQTQCSLKSPTTMNDPVINSALRLIQKKRIYVSALDKMWYQMEQARMENSFLTESAKADSKWLKVAKSKESAELVEKIDKIIKESVVSPDLSTETMERLGGKGQSLESILGEILGEP
ncbi:hypothetical protein HYV44_03120 [Candidatus Microgenomates bacterium]|nr:hypothetical protein [Candidatus Microgenomates bacterium]